MPGHPAPPHPGLPIPPPPPWYDSAPPGVGRFGENLLSARKKRLPLLIGIGIGVAVMLVLAGIGAVVYPKEKNPDTPENAVNAWFGAVEATDVARVRALTCVRYRSEIQASDFGNLRDGSLEWRITALDEIGENTASGTVSVTFDKGYGTFTDTLHLSLIKEDGEWRICGPFGRTDRGDMFAVVP